MAIDWMMRAARLIAIETNKQGPLWLEQDKEQFIRDAIANASPIEDGVVYMPVPRCETCAHWKAGACTSIMWTDGGAKTRLTDPATLVTDKDFGCVQWKAKS